MSYFSDTVRRPRRTLMIGATAVLTCAGAGYAQDFSYPVSSVRLIVPANPGGGTDTAARLFADFFNRYTGTSVAVVNQFAGGGVVAAQTVATGPNDGSELLFYHTSIHVAELTGTWPFGYEDFTPLASVSLFDDVIVARTDAPYDTLAGMIEYAKQHQGEVTFGSQLGGTTEIKGAALAQASEDTLRVVDAGSESDRITALLGKQVDAIPMGVNNAQQYAEAGTLKVLAVLNREPSPFEPDWATAPAQGIDLSFPLVFQVFAPKDLDPEVGTAMDAVIERMKTDPEVEEAFVTIKQSPSLRNSTEMGQLLEQERAFVGKYID